MISNKHSMNSGPVLPLLDEETEAIREFLLETIDDKQDGLRQKENANGKVAKPARHYRPNEVNRLFPSNTLVGKPM